MSRKVSRNLCICLNVYKKGDFGMKRLLVLVGMLVVITSVCTIPKTVYAADIIEESEKQQILENEANEKYNKLLEIWAYDPLYVDDVNAMFPDFYGGAYINHEKELVIQVTDYSEEVIKYFENIIDLTNVKFEEVKYSFNDLNQAHDEIVKRMGEKSTDSFMTNVSGVGVSIPENAVTLYLVIPEEEAYTESIKKEIYENLSNFEKIKVISVSEKDTPASAAVYPGSKISNSTSNRSVGFWAKDGSGNLGIVTAPHSTLSSGQNLSIGSRTFGTTATPYFSGNVDAVFVKRTNTYFTPSRNVPGHGFSLKSSGYTSLAVGSTTYSNGITSGSQTGQVTDINYTTSYGISSCVVTSAPCDHGDSGGIVAGSGTSSSRYIAGIITGKQGGTSYVMYVKATYIMSTLGISVY